MEKNIEEELKKIYTPKKIAEILDYLWRRELETTWRYKRFYELFNQLYNKKL